LTSEERNRHQLRRERTRRQLQEATIALVLEKGFDAIAIQDITDRADLGRGTFYFHFSSKEDALWSVVEDRIHTTERRLTTDFSGQMPDQPEFYGYLNMFRHVHESKDIYRLIVGSNGSQEIANRAKQYMVKETIGDIENFGVYHEVGQPPQVTAQIVVGLLFSLILWWLETPNEYSAEDMAEVLYRTLHHRPPPKIATPRDSEHWPP